MFVLQIFLLMLNLFDKIYQSLAAAFTAAFYFQCRQPNFGKFAVAKCCILTICNRYQMNPIRRISAAILKSFFNILQPQSFLFTNLQQPSHISNLRLPSPEIHLFTDLIFSISKPLDAKYLKILIGSFSV